ncbi:hypothetical protein AB0F45_24155 [Streptomyces achromogenes]|uniref:hypothetical protein n=1 Tax=Streptomyces achromogenes TaxID=67255 RepID=UPI0033C245D1
MTPTAQQSSAGAPSVLAGPLVGPLTGTQAATAPRHPARPHPARPHPALTPTARTLTGTARQISARDVRRDRARERASTAPGGRPCSG